MKRAFDTIAMQAIKINELEKSLAYEKKISKANLEIYKAWNEQDCRRIKELMNEIKTLKQKQSV